MDQFQLTVTTQLAALEFAVAKLLHNATANRDADSFERLRKQWLSEVSVPLIPQDAAQSDMFAAEVEGHLARVFRLVAGFRE